jgi:hypothetical protein
MRFQVKPSNVELERTCNYLQMIALAKYVIRN